ncbi:alpha/beta hydrolase [Barrientosiimonas endolithica]|nr:alpha/beta hydrolase [Barrientosiimonas endolithica]
MSRKSLMPLRVRAFTTVLDRVRRRDLAAMSAEELAREQARVLPSKPPFSLVTGAVEPTVRTSTVQVPMRDGSTVRARVVRSAAAGPDAPVVVYYHGGGWVLGNPPGYDPLTSFLAHELDAVVVAPDYRKAPQHPAPQAAHDAYDTLTWVGSRPAELDASGPIAVAGDSAGGNLSAVVSILARDLDGPAVAGQGLIYPATDLTRSHPSAQWRDEAVLTGEAMDYFLAAYLGGGVEATDPIVSPLFADSHEGLPPALVQTAECDPLLDEGVHYAQVLADAGVPTRATTYVGMPHGFASFPGVTGGLGQQARVELATSLRDWFERARTAR